MSDIENTTPNDGEEMTIEQKKKAINLEDLVYVKTYINAKQKKYEDAMNANYEQHTKEYEAFKKETREGMASSAKESAEAVVNEAVPFSKTIFLYDYQNDIEPEGTSRFSCSTYSATSGSKMLNLNYHYSGRWDAAFLQTIDKTKLVVGSRVRITIGFGSGSKSSSVTKYVLIGTCIRITDSGAYFVTDIMTSYLTSENDGTDAIPMIYLDLGHTFHFFTTKFIDNSNTRNLDYLKIEL